MDHVHSVVKCVILVAIPVGLFIYATSYEKIKVPKNDKAMRSVEAVGTKEGFTVYPKERLPRDLKPGQIVAFAPEKPPPGMETRLAWVVALEGQTVAVEHKKGKPRLLVDGRPFPRPGKVGPGVKFPEVLVPRGHVFVLFEDPSAVGDSLSAGPLPWRRIIGRANVKVK